MKFNRPYQRYYCLLTSRVREILHFFFYSHGLWWLLIWANGSIKSTQSTEKDWQRLFISLFDCYWSQQLLSFFCFMLNVIGDFIWSYIIEIYISRNLKLFLLTFMSFEKFFIGTKFDNLIYSYMLLSWYVQRKVIKHHTQ